MAEQYIEAMKKIQPTGPYFIGSICSGGFVAIEMAHQLHSNGEEVGPLLMIDPPLKMRRDHALLARVKHHYNLLIHRKSLQAKWTKRFAKREQEGLITIDTSDAKAILEATGAVLSFRLALRTYRIPPYGGSILLIGSRERLSGGKEYSKQYLTSNVKFFEICDHHSEIHAVSNERFAKNLQKCMEIAEKQMSQIA